MGVEESELPSPGREREREKPRGGSWHQLVLPSGNVCADGGVASLRCSHAVLHIALCPRDGLERACWSQPIRASTYSRLARRQIHSGPVLAHPRSHKPADRALHCRLRAVLVRRTDFKAKLMKY
eukprot:351134-Chlamydomonas_euryale.AAC.3